MSKVITKLFSPIDSASIVFFRIAFGLLLFSDVIRYWQKGFIAKYVAPAFQFKYYGFSWVHPLPGNGLYYHFAVIGILSLMFAAGCFYRVTSILLTVSISYVFLLDQANYLNHYYMVILFCILMATIPANIRFSVDSLIWPKLRNIAMPQWAVWLLCLQMEVILIYAGIVKINVDWLQLQPLTMWLAERSDYPIMGYFFTQPWAVAIAAYGAIVLHIVGAPLLLFKQTRIYIFIVYVLFHLLNSWVFNIGIFPYLTIFGTLIFFAPSWPRKFLPAQYQQAENMQFMAPTIVKQRIIIGYLIIWIAVQILFPLRHVLYPGYVSWTEEGHRFAWQMKLRDKQCRIKFTITDPDTARQWIPGYFGYLSHRQARKMSARPDMILQFAHFLKYKWQTKYNVQNPIITANSICSLNGRPYSTMIKPNVDLTQVKRTLWPPANWIEPLNDN